METKSILLEQLEKLDALGWNFNCTIGSSHKQHDAQHYGNQRIENPLPRSSRCSNRDINFIGQILQIFIF